MRPSQIPILALLLAGAAVVAPVPADHGREHARGRARDRHDEKVIIIPTGGGINAPLGRTCQEARERMRWSGLPCAPEMPRDAQEEEQR